MKNLTIFGGNLRLTKKLFVNKPNNDYEDEFIDKIKVVFEKAIFTNGGPFVEQLEDKICEYLNVRHCILTNNGTSALQLICKALDVKGEVIVPSYTFIATAHALKWQGLTPVFCDVDKKTNNIDPVECEKLINKNTSAILGVHLWGRPCETKALERLAKKYNIKLFYDSAHAFSCSHNGEMIGGFGDAEAFSFHATKVFHTFEGGAVTTNNECIAMKIRSLRNFGFTDYDYVEGLGINAKMSEINAAMGLINLKNIGDIIEKNKIVYDIYKDQLQEIKGIKLIEYSQIESNNYQYVVIEIDEMRLGLNRDQLVDIFHCENVIVRKYFYPGCHLMEPYVSTSKYDHSNRLVNTDFLTERIVVFPSGSNIESADVLKICELFRQISKNSKEIKAELEKI